MLDGVRGNSFIIGKYTHLGKTTESTQLGKVYPHKKLVSPRNAFKRVDTPFIEKIMTRLSLIQKQGLSMQG